MASPENDENAAGLNGNELDELEEEQTGAISEQENSEGLEEEQFSGDELDESDDIETKPIPEEKNADQPDRRGRGKRGLWLVSAIGLCVLIGIGYLYLKEEKSKGLPRQNSETVPVARISIPGEQLLLFDSFIIPIPENREFTYISLSISFNLPNKEIKREMTEKKKELRGIIYDILAEEIGKRKQVPPLESLKKLIIGGVNSALSTGEVHEVYVTKFLAV
jgi:flagellar basal body-associated protein FliL